MEVPSEADAKAIVEWLKKWPMYTLTMETLHELLRYMSTKDENSLTTALTERQLEVTDHLPSPLLFKTHVSCDTEREEPPLQGILRGLAGTLTKLKINTQTIYEPREMEIKLMEVLKELKAFIYLKELDLSENPLNVPGYIAPFMRVVGSLTSLHALVLRSTFAYPPGLPDFRKSLGEMLPNLTGLTKLHLQNNNLGDGAKDLASALPHLRELCDLNISNTQIELPEIEVIGAALSSLEELTRLTLSNNSSVWGVTTTFTPPTTLTALDVSYNNIDNTGATGLAMILGDLGNMEALNLEGNKIMRVGMRALACPVVRLTNLTELHTNQFGLPPHIGVVALDWSQALGITLPIQHTGLRIEAVQEVWGAFRLRMLAFGSVTHARLGQQSPAHGLDAELVAMILHM
jgi:Leucine-rich repeat (LRR) protein